MKLLYFGREQENGYMNTVKAEQGGIIAEIDDANLEYIDWSSFIYAKKLSDEEYNKGAMNSMKSYNEYWTCDQDGRVSDTWKPTKISNAGKDTDPDGNTWTKTKIDWTPEQMAFILNYDKAWITGKIATFALMAYTNLDVDRGPIDKETWDLQYTQAKDYIQSGSAGILLQELANAKAVSVANLADSIIRNNENYQRRVARVLALSTKLRKEIKNCNTVAQLQAFAEKYLELNYGHGVDPTPARTLFRNI